MLVLPGVGFGRSVAQLVRLVVDVMTVHVIAKTCVGSFTELLVNVRNCETLVVLGAKAFL